jgi:hypothetical protein
MADHRVTARAELGLAAYLDDLAARLPGAGRRRTRILDELRDGLELAAATGAAAGMTADQAVAAAIARFGHPRVVADAFAGELATARARHIMIGYLVTGPVVGSAWLLLLRPQPWLAGPLALVTAIPVVPLIALAVLIAAGTLAGTGRLMRWIPEATPRRALAAAAATAALCIAGDLTMIALCLGWGALTQPLAVVAAGLSAIRVAVSVHILRSLKPLWR